MRQGSYLINVARGSLLVERALVNPQAIEAFKRRFSGLRRALVGRRNYFSAALTP